MGNKVSIPDCFLWSQLPPEKFEELLAERFTVIRTNGEHQNGWRIPSVTHLCHDGRWSEHHAQAWDHTTGGKGEKSWRFHMVLDDAPDVEHCCGWRRVRTFWPSRLTTEEEKEAWWTEFDALVATLKRTRDMTDAEWIPLYEAQKKREAEVVALWGEDEKEMAFQSRRDEALALDPESAARHAFWTEFDAEHSRLKEKLKGLTQQAGNNPEIQEELTAFTTFYGGDEREVGDKLQKRMLEAKAEKERLAALKEREHVLKGRERTLRELDAAEKAAVARKDYRAAEQAQSQKKTAQEYWAEEDAKAAK